LTVESISPSSGKNCAGSIARLLGAGAKGIPSRIGLNPLPAAIRTEDAPSPVIRTFAVPAGGLTQRSTSQLPGGMYTVGRPGGTPGRRKASRAAWIARRVDVAAAPVPGTAPRDRMSMYGRPSAVILASASAAVGIAGAGSGEPTAAAGAATRGACGLGRAGRGACAAAVAAQRSTAAIDLRVFIR
jgi:hypothetical protein